VPCPCRPSVPDARPRHSAQARHYLSGRAGTGPTLAVPCRAQALRAVPCFGPARLARPGWPSIPVARFGSRVPAPVTFSGGACGSGSTTYYYTYVFPCLLCRVHLFHHIFLEAWPWSEVLGCLLPMSPHHWPAAWSWPFDKSCRRLHACIFLLEQSKLAPSPPLKNK
jgi:hypothetical protein